MAHTSPVYLETGALRPGGGATHRYLKTLVEGGLSYLREAIHDPTDTVTYHHGRDDHQHYLEEPFLEALVTLERRIDEWERSS
jgi:hypothetical protein